MGLSRTESNQLNLERHEKISVIMPSFNAEKYVATAIKSCLDQNYKNWELIIVDDCSTDSTVQIVEEFTDSRISLYQLGHNSGPGAARNVALTKCSGNWITVLDADDAMCLNRLSTFLDAALRIGREFVYYDNLLPWISQDVIPPTLDQKSEHYSIRNNKKMSISQWLIEDGFAKPFFHRSLLSNGLIRYPEEIRGPEDTVFLVKLCTTNKVPLIRLATRSYIYRETPGSLSNRGLHQILAIKAAVSLLDAISIDYPSITKGVKKCAQENNDFAIYLVMKEHFKQRRFWQLLVHCSFNPRSLLISARKLREKIVYEFLRMSRNLSRTLGGKLTTGKKTGA